MIIQLGYRMLGNLEEAKDTSQDVFVKYWQSGYAIEVEDKTFSLLYKMMMNRCIDQLRSKRWKQLWIPLEQIFHLSHPEKGPCQLMEDGELMDKIREMLHQLKPRQKACFVMRDLEHLSIREIADHLDCSDNNVKVNLHHARKKMKQLLTPYLRDV